MSTAIMSTQSLSVPVLGRPCVQFHASDNLDFKALGSMQREANVWLISRFQHLLLYRLHQLPLVYRRTARGFLSHVWSSNSAIFCAPPYTALRFTTMTARLSCRIVYPKHWIMVRLRYRTVTLTTHLTRWMDSPNESVTLAHEI